MTAPISIETQQRIGKKIRRIREEKSLSQANVAKDAGISSGYYARIERGIENPSIMVLESICKVFKIKSSEILPF